MVASPVVIVFVSSSYGQPTQANKALDTNRLPAFQFGRAFCCLAVFLFHTVLELRPAGRSA